LDTNITIKIHDQPWAQTIITLAKN